MVPDIGRARLRPADLPSWGGRGIQCTWYNVYLIKVLSLCAGALPLPHMWRLDFPAWWVRARFVFERSNP